MEMKVIIVVIISIIWVGFFVWMGIEYRKRKKSREKKHEGKPLFRTEGDLEEYGKPMDSHPVDFDDAD